MGCSITLSRMRCSSGPAERMPGHASPSSHCPSILWHGFLLPLANAAGARTRNSTYASSDPPLPSPQKQHTLPRCFGEQSRLIEHNQMLCPPNACCPDPTSSCISISGSYDRDRLFNPREIQSPPFCGVHAVPSMQKIARMALDGDLNPESPSARGSPGTNH